MKSRIVTRKFRSYLMWITFLKISGIEYSLLLSSPHIQSMLSCCKGKSLLELQILRLHTEQLTRIKSSNVESMIGLPSLIFEVSTFNFNILCGGGLMLHSHSSMICTLGCRVCSVDKGRAMFPVLQSHF